MKVWCSVGNTRGYSQVLGKALPVSHWHSYQPEVSSENTNILCSRITGLSGRKILPLMNLKVLLESTLLPQKYRLKILMARVVFMVCLHHIPSGMLCSITIRICSTLIVTTIHYYSKQGTSTSHQEHYPLIIFKLFCLTCWSTRPLTKLSPSCCQNTIRTPSSKQQETSTKPTQHFNIDFSKKFKSRRA